MEVSRQPSVSVVIPAYNAADSVGAAISSALSQTHTPLEILVVDDGSSDDTAAVVGAYSAPVSLLVRQNGGVSAARNTAIEQARGDFIALLDADDQLLPRHIEQCLVTWRQQAAVTGRDRIVVTGNAYRFTAAGLTTATILPSDFPRPERQRDRILQTNFIGNFAVYPRFLHAEIGYYDTELRLGEDRELWARAIYSGWQIVAQRTPNAIYRMATSSITADQREMAVAEKLVLAKARRRFGACMTPAEAEYVDLRLSMPTPRELVGEANELIRASSWREAAERLSLAATLVPADRRLKLRALLARHWWGRPLLAFHLRSSEAKLARMVPGPPSTTSCPELVDTTEENA